VVPKNGNFEIEN